MFRFIFMGWIKDLFTVDSIAHALLVLSLVAALGMWLGNIRVFGVSLGITGVLFSGLLFGHYQITINNMALEFARDFGLILFVYTIGVEVGPGFLASLRKQGLPLNLMAAFVVVLGILITLLISHFGNIEIPVAVGLFSGGTTNTPSLAAAQQALKDVKGLEDAAQLPGIGYAIAYPFGVIGVILVMVFARFVFRINPEEEAEAIEELRHAETAELRTMNIEVKNPNLDGLRIKKIPTLSTLGVVISRISRGKGVEIAIPDMEIKIGDILYAVGPQEKLEELRLIVGTESNVDLEAIPSNITTKRILVTKNWALGKTIDELALVQTFGVVVTRIARTGLEFTARPSFYLQFGDVLMAVGEEDSLVKAASKLGDSPEHLDHPHIIPIFIGIALGVIVGSYPLQFAGMPVPVRLGLAGGPLVVAIILSRIGKIGSLIWYMPHSANLMLRQIGIVLFLACVGLRSGDQFINTLIRGRGITWMMLAALITVVPLIVVSIIGRVFYKLNFLSLCGLLSGSMTDPPALAYADSLAPSDAASISYAAVYPLVMLLRVFAAQAIVLFAMK